MIKNECEIIKDLMPNYIEDVISKETKEFVEKHIQNCNGCKKILDELKKEKMNENSDKNSNEFSEINYLKKYNTKINIFRSIAIILIIAIISMWGYIFYRKYCIKKQNEFIENILVTAHENIEKFKENENLSFTTYINSPNGVDAKSFYYKDGKFKEEWVMIGDDRVLWTDYGIMVEGGYDIIHFSEKNNGEGIVSHTDFNKDEKFKDKGDFININWLDSLYLEVRDDIFESKECYVIRKKISDKYYDELWIEKKNMIPIRFCDERESSAPHDFRYEWSIGNVADDDVTIKDKSRKTDNNWDDKWYNEVLDKLLS